MHAIRGRSVFSVGLVALFVLALLPISAPVSAQSSPTSIQNDTFGFGVEWSDDWTLDSTSTSGNDIVLMRGEAVIMVISAYDGNRTTPQELISPGRGDVVLVDNTAANPPQMILETTMYGGDLEAVGIYEAYSINDGQVTILVQVLVPPVFQEAALEFVPAEVSINGTPVLAGKNPADSQITDQAATDPTEEAQTDVVRKPRSGDSDPTAEATVEATTGEITRTPRNGGGDETPEATESVVTRTSRTTDATETPEVEATVAPTEGPAIPDGLETYKGPVFGYSVNYDPAIWEMDTELKNDGLDGVRLVSGTSVLTIWAWDGYGSDPVACLDGEAEYYGQQDERISDWAPAAGADGEPLRYESEELAWGVFNLTYTNTSGDAYPLVDYISCEPIPGQDAVLMVLMSSDAENYNSDLDMALDILDTLQFGNPPSEQSNTGQSTGQVISTNLDGSQYSSANFGYSLEIPLEWQIVDEIATDTDEKIVITDGTSTVTIWGTSSYSGGLKGCVDFAADASDLDLLVDVDSDGAEFRGSYRDAAFANFVYDRDGVEWMYFVNCRHIGDTDAFLIVIQDVEYSKFTAERRSRTDIENSIVMP